MGNGESKRREKERQRRLLSLGHCIMDQLTKLEEQSSLVLVVKGQSNRQGEILL